MIEETNKYCIRFGDLDNASFGGEVQDWMEGSFIRILEWGRFDIR